VAVAVAPAELHIHSSSGNGVAEGADREKKGRREKRTPFMTGTIFGFARCVILWRVLWECTVYLSESFKLVYA
jgi:hypothetical protein